MDNDKPCDSVYNWLGARHLGAKFLDADNRSICAWVGRWCILCISTAIFIWNFRKRNSWNRRHFLPGSHQRRNSFRLRSWSLSEHFLDQRDLWNCSNSVWAAFRFHAWITGLLCIQETWKWGHKIFQMASRWKIRSPNWGWSTYARVRRKREEQSLVRTSFEATSRTASAFDWIWFDVLPTIRWNQRGHLLFDPNIWGELPSHPIIFEIVEISNILGSKYRHWCRLRDNHCWRSFVGCNTFWKLFGWQSRKENSFSYFKFFHGTKLGCTRSLLLPSWDGLWEHWKLGVVTFDITLYLLDCFFNRIWANTLVDNQWNLHQRLQRNCKPR